MIPQQVARVVFDTNTVVSAILFRTGQLAWLRNHWSSGACLPRTTVETLAELQRVLAYSKFNLSPDARLAALGLYLPFCQVVEVTRACPLRCRDPKDQRFLDLAEGGAANILVTGDADLLALTGATNFVIETPSAYRIRVSGRHG
jgi:putative PIN family toxin of toxin-antitoxin system